MFMKEQLKSNKDFHAHKSKQQTWGIEQSRHQLESLFGVIKT